MQRYDEEHNEWVQHRDTPEYRIRKRTLRDLWIVGLLLSILLPAGLQVSAILLGAFLSLCYLDETAYDNDE